MANFHRKGPENRFSQLVTFFSIHQTFKTKQPRGSFKEKARSTKHLNLKNKFKIMFLKFSYRSIYRDNLVLLRFKYVSCLNVKVFE